MDKSSVADFFRSNQVRILSVLLLLQAATFYGMSRGESVPVNRPLSQFGGDLGPWHMVQNIEIEKEVQEILKADDVVSRVYVNQERKLAVTPYLFVAFFRSQRTGQSPHSPKNCLPGNGWLQEAAKIIPVSIPSEPQPIRVNHYLVSKGDQKSVVLYWYQAHNRVVADEYAAKFYVVADAIRMNRTDTALVKIVVNVVNNNEAAATETAVDFLKALFTPLKNYLPS